MSWSGNSTKKMRARLTQNRALVVLFSSFPLLLSVFLVTDCHAIESTAFVSSFVLILLVSVAPLILVGKDGAKRLVESIFVSSSGIFGMALGAAMEHAQRPSCCVSTFDLDTLCSWSTMLMVLFCVASGRVLCARCIQVGSVRICCDWISLPFMLLGMCLGGDCLSAPLTPFFGFVLAAHWAMYIGMMVGHLADSMMGWCVAKIAAIFCEPTKLTSDERVFHNLSPTQCHLTKNR
jgi:hypothetical protein